MRGRNTLVDTSTYHGQYESVDHRAQMAGDLVPGRGPILRPVPAPHPAEPEVQGDRVRHDVIVLLLQGQERPGQARGLVRLRRRLTWTAADADTKLVPSCLSAAATIRTATPSCPTCAHESPLGPSINHERALRISPASDGGPQLPVGPAGVTLVSVGFDRQDADRRQQVIDRTRRFSDEVPLRALNPEIPRRRRFPVRRPKTGNARSTWDSSPSRAAPNA